MPSITNKNLPHWKQLLEELVNKIPSDPPEVVAEIRRLLWEQDFMSVAEWIDARLGEHKFGELMIRRLATAKFSRVHETLSSKPFRAVLTTNYDPLIEIHWHRQGK